MLAYYAKSLHYTFKAAHAQGNKQKRSIPEAQTGDVRTEALTYRWLDEPGYLS